MPTEGNSPFTDPIYTNPALFNFRLAVTSPVLDKCFDPMSTDLDGLSRAFPAGGPNAEAGAFERH